MNTWQSYLVLCPYYRKESKNVIFCEGYISRGINLSFETSKNKAAFKRKYCENNYFNCPFYVIRRNEN